MPPSPSSFLLDIDALLTRWRGSLTAEDHARALEALIAHATAARAELDAVVEDDARVAAGVD